MTLCRAWVVAMPTCARNYLFSAITFTMNAMRATHNHKNFATGRNNYFAVYVVNYKTHA